MNENDEFFGWNNRGYLPHRDDPLQRQFITYRLGDSLPTHVLRELRETHDAAEFQAKYGAYLDAGYGSCLLADPVAANIVVDNWRHHDGVLYNLRDYVLMPTDGHVDIEPLVPLRRITQSWKSYTSKKIISALDLDVTSIWQPGYFDRYHRDRRHSFCIMCYIYLNPVRAGLVDDPFDWEFSSIHRHDEETKDEIRRWYAQWQRCFYRSI